MNETYNRCKALAILTTYKRKGLPPLALLHPRPRPLPPLPPRGAVCLRGLGWAGGGGPSFTGDAAAGTTSGRGLLGRGGGGGGGGGGTKAGEPSGIPEF